MEISREDILKKTPYGLTIYSYILRQYYPREINSGDSPTPSENKNDRQQTILFLRGRDCEPVRNPFNGDRVTLAIKIVDDCAVHTDLERAIPAGDVFDFAALHFKLQDQELYKKLNEVLNLKIGQIRRPQLIQPGWNEPKEPNPSPVFSYYSKPVSNTIPAKEVTLADVYYLVKERSFVSVTSRLRSITDKKRARQYKAQHFDYVTFSGTFSKRNDSNLIKHSGLLAVDFDHIEDPQCLTQLLLADEYFETQLLFVSPSGEGLKWIIAIDTLQAKHQDYFMAVANYIKQTYRLDIDQSGKDVSRACFLPHDPAVIINPKYLQHG